MSWLCQRPYDIQRGLSQQSKVVFTGIKAAICELPFARKASDTEGGAGGTCVLRGCVPKKLMVYGGEFAEAFKDSIGFGCVLSNTVRTPL